LVYRRQTSNNARSLLAGILYTDGLVVRRSCCQVCHPPGHPSHVMKQAMAIGFCGFFKMMQFCILFYRSLFCRSIDSRGRKL